MILHQTVNCHSEELLGAEEEMGGRSCGADVCSHSDKSMEGISGSLQPKALTLVGLTHECLDASTFLA